MRKNGLLIALSPPPLAWKKKARDVHMKGMGGSVRNAIVCQMRSVIESGRCWRTLRRFSVRRGKRTALPPHRVTRGPWREKDTWSGIVALIGLIWISRAIILLVGLFSDIGFCSKTGRVEKHFA
ncbi:hypothetical protein TNIN_157841 [Trichonephila inaurata madagascariensis]|uniref:Uncharacterized protein n=1 Tax=Trichonephila inaurata madagascariensis TaxID=2747483 RepID=A0A8X6YVK0_9ARAC|nr:hypothetical protein TNIN_157841 [Trichonephila inaurata madagascariensis]